MRRVQQPPHPLVVTTESPDQTPSLLELDRFTRRSLSVWRSASKDIDKLQSVLYYGLEPARKTLKEEIRAALLKPAFKPFAFQRWTRIVPFQFSRSPLSAAGSLKGIGGRFNIGCDVESVPGPFPALYIAENFSTAYRERYGVEEGELTDGLTAEELSLADQNSSIAALYLNGNIEKAFDTRDHDALRPICKVLASIKAPKEIKDLSRKLKVNRRRLIVRDVDALVRVLSTNWRGAPIQFGFPAASHVFASFLIDAGYEGVIYNSTKHIGRACLAVFPSNIGSQKTFVELADEAPPDVVLRRLDLETYEELCGWEALRPSRRPST